MIERFFFVLRKIPVIWNTLSWSLLKYLDAKGNVIIKKENALWLIQQVTDLKLDIGLDKYDYLEELMDYDFSIYNQDDVALIIGAGAGLGTILAASVCKKVYAIEPILYRTLAQNVAQSNAQYNTSLFSYAFGKDGEVTCEYWGEKKQVKSKNLSGILSESNPSPTIVKCDCEGCEFNGFLGCDDFKDIRLIEMEYHSNSEKSLNHLINHFRGHGFTVNLNKRIPVPEYKYIGVLYARK